MKGPLITQGAIPGGKPARSGGNYGVEEINIVWQLRTAISKGLHTVDSLVQVQNGAPVDLLLVTDLQSRLGFVFQPTDREEVTTNLLEGEQWSIHKRPAKRGPAAVRVRDQGRLGRDTDFPADLSHRTPRMTWEVCPGPIKGNT